LNLAHIIQEIIDKNPKRWLVTNGRFSRIRKEAPNGSTIGRASVTFPNRNKYILREGQPRGWQEIPVTPWEVANWVKKDLIERQIKPTGRRKPHYHKRAFMELHGGKPWHYLKAKPGVYFDYVLIDIRAAFFSIYRQFSFSMYYYNYDDLIIFLQNDIMDPETLAFLKRNKKIRNALVGISGATNRKVKVDNRLIAMPTGGGNYSWVLWVLHFLQFVIYEIDLACDVVYIGTDSVCVPEKQLDIVKSILSRYNLPYRIEGAGVADIKMQGNYKIGQKQTQLYGRSDIEKPNLSRMENIDQRYKNFQRIIKKYI